MKIVKINNYTSRHKGLRLIKPLGNSNKNYLNSVQLKHVIKLKLDLGTIKKSKLLNSFINHQNMAFKNLQLYE